MLVLLLKTEPVLIVSHVLPGSHAQRSRVIGQGTIIDQINGRKVKTLAEFREALKKSIDTSYLTVKTSFDIFVAFPIGDILNQEVKLSQIYRYPISNYMQEIMAAYKKITPKAKIAS